MGGRILVSLNRPDKAIAALRRAIALDDRCEDAHLTLGKLHLDSGRANEAADCFRRALSINPANEHAMTWLASAQAGQCGADGSLPWP